MKSLKDLAMRGLRTAITLWFKVGQGGDAEGRASHIFLFSVHCCQLTLYYRGAVVGQMTFSQNTENSGSLQKDKNNLEWESAKRAVIWSAQIYILELSRIAQSGKPP